MDFSNQVVLVTGASRGIGAAIADFISERGGHVIGTATSDISPGKSPVEEWVKVDFSDRESSSSFLDWIRKLDTLSACVNNAGINIIKPLVDVDKLDYDRIQKVNLEGPYNVIQAAAPIMSKNGGGRFVNIASIWASITKSHRSLYSTTKAGLLGLTRGAAVELAPNNILVNAVSPGFTMTDLTRSSLSVDEIANLSSNVPLNRFAEVDEIARVVAFLASTENTYLTGQNLVVDGGFTVV